MLSMKKIEIFTDGSSLGNPGSGGWCAILRYGENEKILKGSQKIATNSQMELKAVLEALKVLNQPCEIILFSDSSYVVNAINKWLSNWIKKDFKNVKNLELWQEFIELSKIHHIQAVWVKAHNGHAENEICDKIAKEEAQKVKDE